MKKIVMAFVALFILPAGFSYIHGMENKKKEKRERSFSLNDIYDQKTHREVIFSESFLENLIEQIKQDNFTTFDVVQEIGLKQLYDYIYVKYSDDEILVLNEKIESHIKNLNKLLSQSEKLISLVIPNSTN